MNIDDQIANARESLKRCTPRERTIIRQMIRQLERKKSGKHVDWKRGHF